MANEVFKIEIPIEVNDLTSGGTERATKTLDAFGKAVERTEAQLNKLSGKELTIGDMQQIESAITALERLGPIMNTGRDSFNQLRETISSCSDTMERLNTENLSSETVERYTTANNKAKEALTRLGDTYINAAEATENYVAAMERSEELSEKTEQAALKLKTAEENLIKVKENKKSTEEEIERATLKVKAAEENHIKTMEEEAQNLNEIKTAASQVKNAEAELVSAEQQATQAAKELTDATSQAERESNQWGNSTVSAVNSVASALAAAGIVKLFTEIASAMMECAELSEEYGVSLAKLSTIADTSSIDLSSLKSEITGLSGEIGESVNDLSEASYQAISAGIDTANAVSFTGTATKLAIGGFTEAATAVDVLTTTINAYGKSAENAEDIANMLITTQNLGKTTVDQLAQSVGRVIPVAAAYNVEMDNLMSAYAELTKGGIATAEASTYLKSMLNELGDSGSTVSAVLSEQTGQTFAQLSEAGYSLGDVLAVLGESVDNNATKFNELWSSQEAGVGALSLLNAGSEEYNETLKAMQNSAGATEAAFSKMDNTVADAKEDMINAANNLKIAVGDNLSGAFEGFYNGANKALTVLTNLAEEHPVATRAVLTFTGIMGGAAAAFAVAAAAEAVYTAATTVATTVTTALGVAINVALGPFAIVAGVISGVAAAVTYFSEKVKEARDVTEKLSVSSQRQENELKDLQAQYDELADSGKANTEEAYALKIQIDELSASFESGKKTIGDYTSEAEALKTAVENIRNTYDESISSTEQLEYGSKAVAAQLAALSGKSSHTTTELRSMQSMVDTLNGSYSGLNLTLDRTTGKLNLSQQEIYSRIIQEANTAKREAASDALVGAVGKYQEARETLNESIAEATAARFNFKDIDENYNQNHYWGMLASEFTFGIAGGRKNDTEWNEAQAKMQEMEADETSNREAVAELENGIRDYCDTLGYTTEQTDAFIDVLREGGDAADTVITGFEGLTGKADEFTTGLAAASAAYDEFYNSALESFQGQFGLFDQAQADASATVEAATAALDSQIAYWTNYADNVAILKGISATDLGITQTQYDELMAYAQSGTEQAAGLLNSMAQDVQTTGGQYVKEMAQKFSEAQAIQEETAGEMADWQSGLTQQLEQFGSDMEGIVNNLDKSTEAYTAAENTMSNYIQALNKGKDIAVAAARETASAVAAALQTDSVSSGIDLAMSRKATFHADGGIMTRPHMGIVAEAGPEAIIPLSASKSDRGLDLWLEAGRYLGAVPYADGGIIGSESETETSDIPIITGDTNTGMNISLTMPQVNIEYNGSGSGTENTETMAEIIKEKCKEAGDDLLRQLSTTLKQIFSNMPAKGNA
ncbi:MAG: phage tail tape measure protein [Clostridiales bacterium]|nr:phage tail tape measure protein [Clostridiales bacterium]